MLSCAACTQVFSNVWRAFLMTKPVSLLTRTFVDIKQCSPNIGVKYHSIHQPSGTTMFTKYWSLTWQYALEYRSLMCVYLLYSCLLNLSSLLQAVYYSVKPHHSCFILRCTHMLFVGCGCVCGECEEWLPPTLLWPLIRNCCRGTYGLLHIPH